jgi:hypothetical protein
LLSLRSQCGGKRWMRIGEADARFAATTARRSRGTGRPRPEVGREVSATASRPVHRSAAKAAQRRRSAISRVRILSWGRACGARRARPRRPIHDCAASWSARPVARREQSRLSVSCDPAGCCPARHASDPPPRSSCSMPWCWPCLRSTVLLVTLIRRVLADVALPALLGEIALARIGFGRAGIRRRGLRPPLVGASGGRYRRRV